MSLLTHWISDWVVPDWWVHCDHFPWEKPIKERKDDFCPSLVLIEDSLSTPQTIEGKFFRGFTFNPATGIGTFDDPLRNLAGELVGRVVGNFTALAQTGGIATVAVGSWNFDVFPTRTVVCNGQKLTISDSTAGQNWISTSTGFNNLTDTTLQTEIPDVILNGNGRFLDVNGRVKNHILVQGDPLFDPSVFRIRWEFFFA